MSSAGRKVFGVAAGAAGIAVAGAVQAAMRRRVIAHRGQGDAIALGSLRSPAITVVADDGTPLHVEVDEFDPNHARRGRRLAATAAAPPVTLVFCHGYTLNLDCWHFQRAGYRGQIRSVFYDQRSHGRSGRSPSENSTIDQCARDLLRILEVITHDDPVVLIGHSMGGMTILSLAQQHPEMFGTKIVGVGLIGTTAGGLDPGRIIFPILPAGLNLGVINRLVRTMSRGHRAIDQIRNLGKDAAIVMTDAFAFGEEVPGGYVEFIYRMLTATSFEVVADFYPSFAAHNVWPAVKILSDVPTAIICGTADKLTSIGHSRKLHAHIHGSDLLECPGAGHMVNIERHEQVNSELDALIGRAIHLVESR